MSVNLGPQMIQVEQESVWKRIAFRREGYAKENISAGWRLDEQGINKSSLYINLGPQMIHVEQESVWERIAFRREGYKKENISTGS